MPILPCQRDNKKGYKWGEGGGCVVGPNAKKTVIRQAIKIEGPEKFKQIMKSEGSDISDIEFNEILEEMITAGEIDRYDYYANASLQDEEDFAVSYVSQKERDKMDSSSFGWPSARKFPVNDEAHFKAAVKLLGRAPKSKQAMIKRNLTRIARERGYKLPDSWSEK